MDNSAFNKWATTFGDEALKEEFNSTLRQVLVQSNDQVVLRAQALYRELHARKLPTTFNTVPLQPVPFEGASILLTYAAQCVRDWELLNKGEVGPAPNEIDLLGGWHFSNDKALKELALQDA